MAPKSLLLALAVLPLALVSTTASASARQAASPFVAVSASNGDRPFAGDRRLLTTISPNGDGFRDRAGIHVRLAKSSIVTLVVAKTERRAKPIYRQTYRLGAGPHTLYWAPASNTPARTYLTYIRVGGHTYGMRSAAPRLRQETPAIRVLAVDAAFGRDSYRPEELARLRVAADAEGLTMQVFRVGPEHEVTRGNAEMQGIPVTDPQRYDWTGRRNAPQTLGLVIGHWPSGVYFARLMAGDGRVGFAPFIVRPRRLGEHRVAVVMPTNTWQAYNFHDDDGDGWGDTWYAHWSQRTARTGRPQLDRGVPLCFRRYDLPFLHWLARSHRAVDFLAQRDLELTDGRMLRRAYELLIFPGHHEYVATREYNAVSGFRNRGGNLMFLSANNFFWRIDRRGNRMVKVAQWRDLGRPEAALIGVQYLANNSGRRGPFTVIDVEKTPWLWRGMGVGNGSRFGTFGIEIDKTASSSPRGTRVVAQITNLYGRGLSAQMTYYRTRVGAQVFAAGAFTLAGSATRPFGERLLNNLWAHMTSDRGGATFTLASADGSRKLEAAFARDSYRPGESASLGVWGKPQRVKVQIFRTGPETVRTRGNDEMRGIPVAEEREYAGATRLTIRIGDWATGMYFARLRAGGQVAFAPFVLRPRRLGENRVAVVMPTNTWQAYNFRDDDGDGAADTWYADRRRHTVRVARPHLNHGVPMRFRVYDLPFLHWLAWSKRAVDYMAQTDIERTSGRALRQRYELIIFPGHHEYVTGREYNAVTRYRDLGGNLMFLSANNFFWKVERRGNTLHQIVMWRDLGRPEAALVGVQYVTYGSELRGPYAVRNANAAPWLFRGTGLRNGSRFGTFGIEIDRRTAASRRNTVVLAEIQNGQGAGKAGQMTYYRTRRGAKVFAAGAFTLAGSATRSYGKKLLNNLWRHMAR